MRFSFAFLAASMLMGCARYEYDVIAPQDVAGRAGRQADHRFTLEPLEYRLRTVDNRLVMRIYNPTDETITLHGGRSAAVDPDGQSHPLQTQTIAPGGSFIKLILPPPRPRVYRSGPTIGFGVGGHVGHYRHPGYRRSHYYGRAGYYYPRYYGSGGYGVHYWPYAYEPRYLSVYDDYDTYYWDWSGEGEVQLRLAFARGDPPEAPDEARTRPSSPRTFAHELVLRRVRVR